MTFARAKLGGWAFGEILTSAQMNALDIDHTFALDGRDGGVYNVTAQLEYRNALWLNGATLPVSGQVIMLQVDGSTAYNSASDATEAQQITGHVNLGSGDAGDALVTVGGAATTGRGGHALQGTGGASAGAGVGGTGLISIGGVSTGGIGGAGGTITGAASANATAGGAGLTVTGGNNSAGGGDAGIGIFVQAGNLGSGAAGKAAGLGGEIRGGTGSFDGAGGGGLVVDAGDHGDTATEVGAVGIDVHGGSARIGAGGLALNILGGDRPGAAVGDDIGGGGLVCQGGGGAAGGLAGKFTGGSGSVDGGAGIEVFGTGGAIGALIEGGSTGIPAMRVNGTTGNADAIRANAIGTGAAVRAVGAAGEAVVAVATVATSILASNTSATFPAVRAINTAAYSATGAALSAETGNGNVALRLSAAGATDAAHMSFEDIVIPASKASGDFWFDGSNLIIRIGASDYTLDMTVV